MLRNGVIPIPPARNTAVLAEFLLQRERTHGRVNLHLGAQCYFLQGALKRRVAPASGEHPLVFKSRTGNRKSARVALRVSFWRIGQCQIGRLPRLSKFQDARFRVCHALRHPRYSLKSTYGRFPQTIRRTPYSAKIAEDRDLPTNGNLLILNEGLARFPFVYRNTIFHITGNPELLWVRRND